MKHSQLISHRGLWTKDGSKICEHNSLEALEQALDAGFGVEVDLRDFAGQLAVSHDIPIAPTDPYLIDLICKFESPVALNVKADGLTQTFPTVLRKLQMQNSFFFDMSFPERIRYINFGLTVGHRVSDLETEVGVGHSWAWVDAWNSEWYLEDLDSRVNEILRGCERLVFVSPELHKRDPELAWSRLSELMESDDRVHLCTDFPDVFFKRFGQGRTYG